ncbi:MAG: hypothetical protein ACLU9T_17490 [Blautia faecis]
MNYLILPVVLKRMCWQLEQWQVFRVQIKMFLGETELSLASSADMGILDAVSGNESDIMQIQQWR